ncbi:PHA/PHB synthase family protein [Massilia violaceinigra]|uniref:PHA/PHB synthase family protein n=1 Tax=Massilia violaceinigra TaxID=2045208 RepID=UPI001FB4DD89|nr:alpha/beta fold hydrolase [Massilia violaceinigra]
MSRASLREQARLRDQHDIEPAGALDRALHGSLAQLTQGISIVGLTLAWMDWGMHLAQSPGKWGQLLDKAWRKNLRWCRYAGRAPFESGADPCIAPLPQDRRFSSPAWQRWPYHLLQQAFLLNQQWWHNATTGIDGVSTHHEDMVTFMARQMLDMLSPPNFIPTNPDVCEAALREGGANFLRGAGNLADDLRRNWKGEAPAGSEHYLAGIHVAVTPGRVIIRNRLMELIQYAPTTAGVHAEPMLIVPAWIMKYYILDLSPHNSLVRYLVDQGHTVFMISWHNPTAADRDLGLDDYLDDGVYAALQCIRGLFPGERINTVGYCLGGTLLAIAVGALASTTDATVNSMTLLAAQTDFSEAGELMLFIDESQIDWLEDLMRQQGYLDNRQMAGAFRALRSNDLVWSAAVNQYLLGRRAPMTDLMAWNTDTTRMPFRMHSEYLRKLFLSNDLSSGRYQVGGRPVALSDIRVPLFGVATASDHVSPWRSVYKLHLLSCCDLDFVLTSGGHNAGIVSEPGHPGRRYSYGQRRHGSCYVDPDRWLDQTEEHEGSWWPAWSAWLERVSTGGTVTAREPHGDLGPAPGRYVLER